MNKIIKEQAKHLGFEISDWDVEQIKKKYFQSLVTSKIANIRAAIETYFKEE